MILMILIHNTLSMLAKYVINETRSTPTNQIVKKLYNSCKILKVRIKSL